MQSFFHEKTVCLHHDVFTVLTVYEKKKQRRFGQFAVCGVFKSLRKK